MTDFQLMPPDARVWIYQSNRPFSDMEQAVLRQKIREFVESWTSHNLALRTFGDIFHDRFIVLMVDESQAGASGCSIDESVRFVKEMGQQFKVELFDRMLFAWQADGEIKTATAYTFGDHFQKGHISKETLIFNNLVSTKKEFEEGWLVPLKESWHHRFI